MARHRGIGVRTRQNQVEQLYSSFPVAGVVVLINATILAAVQWPVINHAVVISWWTVILVVTLSRFFLLSQFRRVTPIGKDIEVWANRFFVGVLFSGVGWGGAGFLLFPDQEALHQMFTIFVLAGMAAGSVTTLALDLRAVWSFLLLILVPLVVRLSLVGSLLYLIMAAMVSLFIVGVALGAKSSHGVMLKMLRMREEYLEQREEMKLSEDMFLKAFLSSPSSMAISKFRSGRFLHVNEGFLTTLGYEEHEVIGKTSAELGLFVDDHQREIVINKVLEGEVYRGAEIPVRTKSGEILTGLFSAGLIAIGSDPLLFVVMTDVSERKRAEELLRLSEERYRALFEEIPAGIYETSADGKVIEANPALARLLGFTSPEELKNLCVVEGFVDPNDRREWRARIEREGVIDSEVKWFKRDGSPIWVREVARTILDDEGKIAFYKGVIEDITARHTAEAEVRRTVVRVEGLRAIGEAVLAARSVAEIAQVAVEHTRILIPCSRAEVVEIDSASKVATLLGSASDILNRELGAIIAAESFPLGLLGEGNIRLINDLSAIELDSEFDRDLRSAGVRSTLVVPLIARGELIGALYLGSLEKNGFSGDYIKVAREVAGSVAVALHDARLKAELRMLAVTDTLTGLHSRRNLFELGRVAFERDRRFNRSFSAIMLDIDHFKRINDTQGHLVGDEVLRTVADRCQEVARSIDIVGRYGGDELVILMPETNLGGAAQLAERLRHSIAEMMMPINEGASEITITVSLGVAERGESSANLSTLIDRADKAMYEAKKTGRNRLVGYEHRLA